MEEEVENIAEEECSFLDLDTETAIDQTSCVKFKVTIDTVKVACQELTANPSVSDDVQRKIADLNIAELHRKLQWIGTCIGPKGRFINTAREKACSSFHQTFIHVMSQVTELTKCTQVTAKVCMKVFDICCAKEYGSNQTNVETDCREVQEEEKGTVLYVGGCIIKKLKRRLFSMKKSTRRDERLDCLEQLVENGSDHDQQEMTRLLDRGGLTYIKPLFGESLIHTEILFRKMCGSGNCIKQVAITDFIDAGLKDSEITSAFFGCLSECDISTSLSEHVLQLVLELFFRIRIHHKLKTTMDTIRRNQNKEKKEKGLRKRLKMT